MPGYDQTGPRGEGPQTGRMYGHCGDRAPAHWRHGCRGLAASWGWGRRSVAPPEVDLEEEERLLKEELEWVRKERAAQSKK